MSVINPQTHTAPATPASEAERPIKVNRVLITAAYGRDPYCHQCGYPFDTGDTAREIAGREDGRLFCSNLCARNHDRDRADQEPERWDGLS